jgi:type II secretory pathway pseudopilin PulG
MEAAERFRTALKSSRIAPRRWPVAWAIAAALTLALGASLFFANRFSARESALRTQLADLQRRFEAEHAAAPAPLVASTFFLTLTRGEDSVNRVALPSAPAWIALSPDADMEAQSGNLRAAITDSTGAVVWSQSGLHATPHQAFAVVLPPGTLHPGDYILTLDRISPPAPLARYRFICTDAHPR